MKYLIIFIYLLLAQSNVAMEKHQSYAKLLDAKGLISRIIFKAEPYNFFTGYIKGERECAFAIEPFYYLQSYEAENFLRTSPIKAIKRLGDLYHTYTASGSVYKARSQDLVKIETQNHYSSFLVLCRCRFICGEAYGKSEMGLMIAKLLKGKITKPGSLILGKKATSEISIYRAS